LTSLLKAGKFALVHAHDGNSKIKALLASLWLNPRPKIIATQHFVEPAYTKRHGWKGWASRIAHSIVNTQVSRHIAVSQAVREAMVHRGEAPSSRISVVPNGVTIDRSSAELTAVAKRSELRVDEATPLIVTVARLAPEKGISYLVRAIKEVKASLIPLSVVIVGDGALRQSLEKEVSDLDLSSTVKFLGFREDVLAIVAAADIFVLPSIAEPFGIALVEAMALGKPCIAVNAGGPVEIVADGETGILVPACDPHALADAIINLVQNGGRAKAMGAEGMRRAEERFSAKAMGKLTDGVYQQALGS
jgi:glycosyltransferase involved in cell wall biosynthesis